MLKFKFAFRESNFTKSRSIRKASSNRSLSISSSASSNFSLNSLVSFCANNAEVDIKRRNTKYFKNFIGVPIYIYLISNSMNHNRLSNYSMLYQDVFHQEL